jgi:hypothetical protein
MPAVTGDAVANFEKFVISQSDAGAEIVVSATKTGGFRDADILAVYRQLTVSGGDGTGTDSNGPDAFTVAGFGTANGTFQKDASTGIIENGAGDTLTVVYFRIQGSGGTPNLTTVDASTYRENDTNDITLAAVAHFKPAL